MYQGQTLSLIRLPDNRAELCFDREGETVNKFDAATIGELNAAVQVLQADNTIKGLLLTSAKDAFIVGADIFEFTSLFSQGEAALQAYNLAQSEVFTALSELPLPSVSAINSLALGGGFEVTLATDYRVIGESTQVGFPEVGLGIFPGLGGMARLPRLADVKTTIDWVTSGRPQKPAAAQAAGAVDTVVADAELRGAALALLDEAIGGQRDWRQRRTQRSAGFSLNAELIAAAKSDILQRNPHVPAPLAAIELLERSADLSLAEALLEENKAFSSIAQTQAAQALVQLFINDQFLRKKAKAYTKAARKIEQVAVLGAGIMGGGIAYTSAARGIPAIMKDIAQPSLDLGMNEAGKLLAKQVSSGRLAQDKADAILASITPTLSYEGIGGVNVVVEAVVENLKVKKAVLAEVENQVQTDAVLASNTSSLSITDLAGALKRPENFVGMHFFNPVPVMPLVEVIRGPHTSDESADTVAAYAIGMGKTPIVVKDCPGFLVNRILTANVLGFLRLVHDGGDYRAIDAALEAFGWPMGPAYLQDVIGMDTSFHVVDYISAGYGERMLPNYQHAISLMVENQRLGQKNGVGFYRYEKDSKGRPVKAIDTDTEELLKTIQPNGSLSFSSEEIVDRVMLPTIIEAARALEEGIAGSVIEVDMALILGLGFPRHVGGPLKYADWLGLPSVIERCRRYSDLGGLYQPTETMLAMAARAERFYP